MSQKKTDLVKNLAKKLDGKMKAAGVPQRFAQGASKVAAKREQQPAREASPKLVPVACRLPAELVNRLRERALASEGGMNAVMAEAVGQWLDGAPAAAKKAKAAAPTKTAG
jgi:hypothetical protein